MFSITTHTQVSFQKKLLAKFNLANFIELIKNINVMFLSCLTKHTYTMNGNVYPTIINNSFQALFLEYSQKIQILRSYQ